MHLVFLWLPSAEMAIARVQARVKSGGHDVPSTTIERRYYAGLKNFFSLYIPLATTWRLVDNSSQRRKIASAKQDEDPAIFDPSIWSELVRKYSIELV
jgi:predicted ABC-type ATPase